MMSSVHTPASKAALIAPAHCARAKPIALSRRRRSSYQRLAAPCSARSRCLAARAIAQPVWLLVVR